MFKMECVNTYDRHEPRDVVLDFPRRYRVWNLARFHHWSHVMRILVCGGRNYRNEANVFWVLDNLHAQEPITAIIEGECPYGGADVFARHWGESRGVAVLPFAPDVDAMTGHVLGPARNRRMLVEGKPDAVVAFPGGRGTADMVDQALAAGVHVIIQEQ